ncbi:hypothetical protein BFJ63_vAg2936 [Fusarium oxysporum f. sp. narcissi]|uniref:Uncharacterized protein n=3 Tax=Fusarium oxysporum TaxID=5507 RepID=A0A420Q3Z6_FUSOX|nr:hypothetical protein BFJ65_g8883 [Fusarium oxysporum f. sp. cepae]RKK99487.1 hypothetical protein BFJ71_g6083 [Fusarium oxysporum]RYC94330.1 hypothetical protein BFJ63_vAg2936 [Fusarium oxysporum f. sp. narcissi]RKK55827.1 hypothetical protein BFJ67_g4150 [Fusarium oxysporum f. sp. cepae]RKK57938.1 hypothetical protein BFJ66_g2955 [Fusarium oxysporum f. sp. cepae]
MTDDRIGSSPPQFNKAFHHLLRFFSKSRLVFSDRYLPPASSAPTTKL